MQKFRENGGKSGTTKRVVNDERGCRNFYSNSYDMAYWTAIYSTGS
jgi:hypothetical protein